MVKSMTAATSVPHFHFVEEINCASLIQLKSAFQKENSDLDIKFTFLPVLIKSLSLALTTHPLVNSKFNLETYEVTLKGPYTLSSNLVTNHFFGNCEYVSLENSTNTLLTNMIRCLTQFVLGRSPLRGLKSPPLKVSNK